MTDLDRETVEALLQNAIDQDFPAEEQICRALLKAWGERDEARERQKVNGEARLMAERERDELLDAHYRTTGRPFVFTVEETS